MHSGTQRYTLQATVTRSTQEKLWSLYLVTCLSASSVFVVINRSYKYHLHLSVSLPHTTPNLQLDTILYWPLNIQ